MGASMCFALASCARTHGETTAPASHAGSAGRSASSAKKEATGGVAAPASQKPAKASAVGTMASAALDPLDASPVDGGATVSGLANFTVTTTGVDLSLTIKECPASGEIQFFILAGSDCSSATLDGSHWDGARGEGIPNVWCVGGSGPARGALSRSNDDAKPWSIGGASGSDLLGHAFVAYDATSGTPVACGVITQNGSAPATSQPTSTGIKTPLLARAMIAGTCLGGMFVRDNTQSCPDPMALSSCAAEHCQLDDCVATCADYLACTEQAADPCSVAFSCPIDSDCMRCADSVQACALSFCADEFSCAAPVTPGGPCSQLEACCELQGDKSEPCLMVVHEVEQLSGDPSCFGVMRDQQFFSHLSVPCMFQ